MMISSPDNELAPSQDYAYPSYIYYNVTSGKNETRYNTSVDARYCPYNNFTQCATSINLSFEGTDKNTKARSRS